MIECPPLEGRERNAADIHMVLDTIDALDHPTGYDEFILMSADADFTPVLLRLRAHNRATVIFANDVTAANYTAIADAMIEEGAFTALLAGEEPAEEASEPEAASVGATGDRNALETLARKIHAATNVPMFSPRTFADLFRILAQEIAEQGYHFQKTAENVTAKLAEAGRNVNRRQVLFVVKGLALKGHVFSTTDTPERLAEVFREQVLYLAGSAGLDLGDDDKALLPAWIVGRVPQPARAEAPAAKKPDDTAVKKPVLRRRPTRPVPPPKPEAAKAEAAKADTTKMEASKTEPVGTEPAATEPTPTERTAPPAKKPESEGGSPIQRRLADIRAGSASRLAAIARSATGGGKASTAASNRTSGGASPKSTPSTRVPSKPAADKEKPGEAAAPAPAGQKGQAALESSILAAIAQAVDVLVEDGGGATTKDELQPPAESPVTPEAPEPAEAEPAPEPAADEVEPEPSDGGDSDDIGDEIQRIIASYSRARQKG